MWFFLKNDELGSSKYNQENRDAGMGCSIGEVYKISDLLGRHPEPGLKGAARASV